MFLLDDILILEPTFSFIIHNINVTLMYCVYILNLYYYRQTKEV